MNPIRLVPAAETRVETRAGNSRFVAAAAPSFTVDEARDFIARISVEYADATHNVPAYLIGHGQATIAHCQDDGEPSGTAGRPMLAVLQGSGLGDIAVVVNRYFGGTKLGTGGLVRAYRAAVRAVLDDLPRAEKVATVTTTAVVPYTLLERARLLVANHAGTLIGEAFAAGVTLTARFRAEHYPAFASEMRDLSHGAVETVVVEASESTIMPLTRS